VAVRSITLYVGDKSLKNFLTNSSCQQSYIWLQFDCGLKLGVLVQYRLEF